MTVNPKKGFAVCMLQHKVVMVSPWLLSRIFYYNLSLDYVLNAFWYLLQHKGCHQHCATGNDSRNRPWEQQEVHSYLTVCLA